MHSLHESTVCLSSEVQYRQCLANAYLCIVFQSSFLLNQDINTQSVLQMKFNEVETKLGVKLHELVKSVSKSLTTIRFLVLLISSAPSKPPLSLAGDLSPSLSCVSNQCSLFQVNDTDQLTESEKSDRFLEEHFEHYGQERHRDGKNDSGGCKWQEIPCLVFIIEEWNV